MAVENGMLIGTERYDIQCQEVEQQIWCNIGNCWAMEDEATIFFNGDVVHEDYMDEYIADYAQENPEDYIEGFIQEHLAERAEMFYQTEITPAEKDELDKRFEQMKIELYQRKRQFFKECNLNSIEENDRLFCLESSLEDEFFDYVQSQII